MVRDSTVQFGAPNLSCSDRPELREVDPRERPTDRGRHATPDGGDDGKRRGDRDSTASLNRARMAKNRIGLGAIAQLDSRSDRPAASNLYPCACHGESPLRLERPLHGRNHRLQGICEACFAQRVGHDLAVGVRSGGGYGSQDVCLVLYCGGRQVARRRRL